ncbi:MAG TPA: hypothetical protein DCM08_06105 [Microscillaceae bacterium]|nr:hypothetical protein [Microscillaceae bacterium]
MPKPDFLSPVYMQPEEPHLEVVFVENFKKAQVDFFFCENLEQFLVALKAYLLQKNLQHVCVWEKYLQELCNVAAIPYHASDDNLLQVEASITLCESLMARTGSILVSSRQLAGRRLTIYPPVHIVVAFTSQIKPDITEALEALKQKYTQAFPSMLSVISGPSQTADIEKTLVLGAHGPKELSLFLIDE